MIRFYNFLIVVCLFSFSSLLAKEVSPKQYFYMVKKIFPDTKNINVLIQGNDLEPINNKIATAAAQNRIKAMVYPVSNLKSIGLVIKNLENLSVLVIYPSQILLNKSSRLYILSKCKEKKIAVFTVSKEYSDSGALLGIFPQEGQATSLVLNLKHSQYLLSKFTPNYIKQLGITEVIQ